jgi:hypothetical protein
MNLIDLNPRWVVDAAGRKVGVNFDCPCCRGADGSAAGVLFANPIGGGAPEPRGWQREGETFETLTVSPSILVHARAGHAEWHGWLKNGVLS